MVNKLSYNFLKPYLKKELLIPKMFRFYSNKTNIIRGTSIYIDNLIEKFPNWLKNEIFKILYENIKKIFYDKISEEWFEMHIFLLLMNLENRRDFLKLLFPFYEVGLKYFCADFGIGIAYLSFTINEHLSSDKCLIQIQKYYGDVNMRGRPIYSILETLCAVRKTKREIIL